MSDFPKNDNNITSEKTWITGKGIPSQSQASDRREPDAGASSPLKQLGRYQLIQKIGEGGMGVVYKAHDPQLQRPVALKILLAGEYASRYQIERFLREAKAMAQLRHPNIVTIYDIGSNEGTHFFTMDFIQGVSLNTFVKQKRLDVRQIAILMFRVADAVHYAHTQGIIHRDLKPANVMIDAANTPKVMDFGLAKMEQEDVKLSNTGMIMGSLHYMPLEQAEGNHDAIDARSDVYAMGVMLYELLSGRVPYDGETSLQILQSMMAGKIVPLQEINANIPPKLIDICAKAMARSKEDRYPSALDLAKELRLFVQGHAPTQMLSGSIQSQGQQLPVKTIHRTVSSVPTTTRMQKQTLDAAAPPKNHRQRYLLLGGGIVILLLALAVLLGHGKSPGPGTSPWTIAIQLVNNYGQQKSTFSSEHLPFVKVRWSRPFSTAARVTLKLYGDNIKECEEQPNSEQLTWQEMKCAVKLIRSQPGDYQLTAQLTVDDVSQEKLVKFTIAAPAKPQAKPKPKPKPKPEEIAAKKDQQQFKTMLAAAAKQPLLPQWHLWHQFAANYRQSTVYQDVQQQMANIENQLLRQLQEATKSLQAALKKLDLAQLPQPTAAAELLASKWKKLWPELLQKNQNLRRALAEFEKQQKQLFNAIALALEQQRQQEVQQWQSQCQKYLDEKLADALTDRQKYKQALEQLQNLAKKGQAFGKESATMVAFLKKLGKSIANAEKLQHKFKISLEQKWREKTPIHLLSIDGKNISGYIITHSGLSFTARDKDRYVRSQMLHIHPVYLWKNFIAINSRKPKKKFMRDLAYILGILAFYQGMDDWAERHFLLAQRWQSSDARYFLQKLEKKRQLAKEQEKLRKQEQEEAARQQAARKKEKASRNKPAEKSKPDRQPPHNFQPRHSPPPPPHPPHPWRRKKNN